MTLDQFYGLLALVRLSEDETKSRSMTRLLRRSHYEQLAGIGDDDE